MTKFFIATPQEKYEILKKYESSKELEDFKFISLTELVEMYYGTYQNTYLLEMQKLGFLPSVANDLKLVLWKVANHESKKIKKLYELKQYLLQHHIMLPATYQKEYLKKHEVCICGEMQYQIPKYMLNDMEKDQIKITYRESDSFDTKISYMEFSDIRDEISTIGIEILKAYQSGVSLDQIHLLNVSSDYQGFCVHILELLQIPYSIQKTSSIYSMTMIQMFLNEIQNINGSIQLLEEKIQNMIPQNDYERDALEKLAHIYSKYRKSDTTVKEFIEVLEYELKNTYTKSVMERNAITVDSGLKKYGEEDLYFVLNFNQETMPPIFLDLDYLNDAEKKQLEITTTVQKNESKKREILWLLTHMKYVTCSYSSGSPFTNFSKSSLLKELKTFRTIENVIPDDKETNQFYNRYLLATSLDTYYKYREKTKEFNQLLGTTFIEDYKTYQNQYQTINEMALKDYLNGEMVLSYSSMDTYFHCPFRFYLRHILKVPETQSGSATMIGTFFHEVLSMLYQTDSKEECISKALEKFSEESDVKESFYLQKYKKELIEICSYLKEELDRTEFQPTYFERKFELDFDEAIHIKFMGVIDKILTFTDGNQTYAIVIDYKTGKTQLNLNKVIYGLDMQLLVYLYFLKHHPEFQYVKVAGFYLQHILPDVMNYQEKKTYALQRKEFYQLDGYTNDSISLVSHIDHDYVSGGMIRGLRVTKDNTFYSTAKVIDENTINRLLEIVEENINDVVQMIQKADFKIQPIRLGNEKTEEITGCKYCQYYDICFKKITDIKTVKEYKKLEFLGGDEK